MKSFLKPFKEAKGGERVLLIASTVGLVVGILFLLWYFRNPLISFVYPSKSKTHETKTFKANKVKIVQYGDKIKGKKDKDSKVVLHIFPDKVRKELKVDEEGEWRYKITEDLKENQKYLLVVQYLDQQNNLERVRSYKIKVVSNRKLYKQKKQFVKNIEKAQKNLARFLTGKKEEKKVKESKRTIPESKNTHPELFYANLEYDVNTKKVKKLASGKKNGDLQPLLPSHPPASDKRFSFKIELVLGKNKVWEGWESLSKEIIEKEKNKLEFTITTPYQPKGIVNFYTEDNQLIWKEQIQ